MAGGNTEREFVITRTFDAPREVMWKAWTEQDRLMQWFGPKGFTMSTAKLDFRPGGTFHYCLLSASGQEIWGKFLYREIAKPERLVWVNSFSDPDGGITRHPMMPTWPRELLTTVTFAESGGRTTVTVRWATINPTDAERKTFDTGHDSMRQGWTGTFEQLEGYLAQVQAGGQR
jgi:uncharacterized protein YndB with AHSA1/START domain